MISEPISFDTNEQQIISQELAKASFDHQSWSDTVFDNIRTRIKTYHVEKQNYKCCYCKQVINSTNGRLWDIEHIIPRENIPLFMFEPENLCVSCTDCNGNKSNKKITISKAKKKYPKQPRLYLIIHPHFDDYDRNILVIKEGFYYVALEKKGEKTIEICGLNRFYQFVDYNEDVADDDLIRALSDALMSASDDTTKRKIRNQIASLSIRANMAAS